MRCIWCDRETTTDESKVTALIRLANKEHIIPECVGGKKCLQVGKVCASCNGGFNKVDRDLRDKHSAVALHCQNYLLARGRLGKRPRGGSKDRNRKSEMKTNFPAFENGVSITRADNGERTIRNASGGIYTEPYNGKFSRALHKCAVNVIANENDNGEIKAKFSSLIEFVKTEGADYRDWPYGICYANPLRALAYDPQWFVAYSGGVPSFVVLFLPGVIAVVGLRPNYIDPALLNKVSSIIYDWFRDQNMPVEEIKAFFSGPLINESVMLFGEHFKFHYLRQQVSPTPRDDENFDLLINCRVCGQINPSHFVINKTKLLLSSNNHSTVSQSRGWNRLTKEDLIIKGYHNVDSWPPEVIETQLKQPFTHPPIHAVFNSDQITNCSTTCVNCGHQIEFDGAQLYI